MQIVDVTAEAAMLEQAATLLIEGFAASWPDRESALREVRESLQPDRISRVAITDDGAVIGWIGGISAYHGNTWELHPLVVHAEYRGQGIGRQLVLDLEEQVRARGGATIYLGTDDEENRTSLSGIDVYPNLLERLATMRNLNRHPYEFYQKLGYALVGLIPDANGFGKPDIVMAKRIREWHEPRKPGPAESDPMAQAQEATVTKIRQIISLRNQDVLEIGCGDGRLTALLAEGPRSLIAIDPDAQRIAQAKSQVPGVDFRVGSGEHLDCADASFDIILFTLSLHHQNSAAALQEAYRAVKPGGCVVVVEPTEKGRLGQIDTLFHDERQEQQAAQRAIRACDFELEHYEYYDTDWVFDDLQAVYDGFAQNYDAVIDEPRQAQITAIIGEHIHNRPLVLTDTLLFTCLRKPA